MSLDMMKTKPGTNMGQPMVGNLFQNMNGINGANINHGATSPMQTNPMGVKK